MYVKLKWLQKTQVIGKKKKEGGSAPSGRGADLKVKFHSSNTPPPSSIYVNARIRWLWMAVKNYFPFSIIWIGFRWCEGWDSVNFMEFSDGFWMRPPSTHLLTPSRFGILKVFRWYISGLSFIYVWSVVLEFWNFRCFHTSRQYNFRLLLGGFLNVTQWNVAIFVWNFDQWCNALWCIKHMKVFILFLKNTWI